MKHGENKNVNEDGNPYYNFTPDMSGFTEQAGFKNKTEDVYDFGDFGKGEEDQKWTKGNSSATTG